MEVQDITNPPAEPSVAAPPVSGEEGVINLPSSLTPPTLVLEEDESPAEHSSLAPPESDGGHVLKPLAAPSSSLVLEVVGDCMKIPSSPAEITVMAKLSAVASSAPEEGQDSRAPITICAAIDRSGSMRPHLPLLKETLLFMIQQLRPKDQLCLVTFDNEVCVELPLTAMTADGKLQAEQAVRRVREGGRTNMSGGLLAALEALYRIKEDDASLVESVLLFTDGKANVGIKDQATLTKATKSMLEQINRQVCVFTFGYGSEHDADLLLGIAEAGNGLFYYIDSEESIPESFCDCLGGLLSVAAQNVKLTFTSGPQVTLSRPITSYKVTEKEPNHTYQVTIHDIYSEEERCILAKASLPADAALEEPTSVAVVTCEVEFFDVVLHKPNKGTVTFSVVRNRALQNPVPADAREDIELHRMRCEVASTLGKATDLANLGHLVEARQMLAQVQGRVESSTGSSKPLARHLVGTLGESIQGLQDKVTFKKHGKAVLNNYKQSHWQQRSNATPSQEGYDSRRTSFGATHPMPPSSSGALPGRVRRATLGAPPIPPPLRGEGATLGAPPIPPRSLHGEALLTVSSPYRSKSKSNMMEKHASSISSDGFL